MRSFITGAIITTLLLAVAVLIYMKNDLELKLSNKLEPQSFTESWAKIIKAYHLNEESVFVGNHMGEILVIIDPQKNIIERRYYKFLQVNENNTWEVIQLDAYHDSDIIYRKQSKITSNLLQEEEYIKVGDFMAILDNLTVSDYMEEMKYNYDAVTFSFEGVYGDGYTIKPEQCLITLDGLESHQVQVIKKDGKWEIKEPYPLEGNYVCITVSGVKKKGFVDKRLLQNKIYVAQ